ncbi:MAG TPA: MltA domain-containing protein [Planctomycetota bacterium]|nr:MltA domain-containing protein [Planctomycetota bacterium]
MRRLTASVLVLTALAACQTRPEYGRPLPEGWPALIKLAPGEARPDFAPQWNAREALLPALERSIAWTRKKHAEQFFPIEGISHAHALASLERFRDVLVESSGPADFRARLERDFDVYRSAGWNGLGGGVLFTGYCTPILKGSLAAAPGYDWPLYGLPEDLAKGPQGEILGRTLPGGGLEPYPTRRVIESSHMFAGQGLELAWLSDPLDAFLAHVNGSAFIELPDGSMVKLGYAGKNGRAYTSLGGELVKDKQLKADRVSLSTIRAWAARHPEKVLDYLHRNESYVFFTEISGTPRGSLNVEVEPGRTLATDKRLFPRGAVVFVDTELLDETGRKRPFEQFLLDQDTGGAIRTAGRADIYLGIGPEAEALAGRTRAEGQLYYLFLADTALAELERSVAP